MIARVFNNEPMRTAIIVTLLFAAAPVQAKTWLVGPTRQYAKPSQVMALVSTGDTVEIDPGLYVKDVGAWNADSLVLRCSNGYAHLDAQGTAAQRKAIWVINGKHNLVEGIEFSGCAISATDGENGAGIRLQSTSFACRRCYFHDNQEGILTGNDTTTEVSVEACEFEHNGVETSGGGYQHNIYVGHSRVAWITFCYFHRSIVGHEIKSRANKSYILYNRVADEDGDGSYCIDLPNGGLAYVIGNTIEKGPNASNRTTAVLFGEEGIINPDSEFYFVNNTLVSEIPTTTLIRVQSGARAKVINNLFLGSLNLLNGQADTVSNIITKDTSLFHFRNLAAQDYHVTAPYPGMAGIDPGTAHGFSLRPTSVYVHPLDSARRSDEPLQLGALPYVAPARVETEVSIPVATVFPNPLSTNATIELPSNQIRAVRIVIVNSLGEVVRDERLTADVSHLTIDRGCLAAGVYQCQFMGASGELVARAKMSVLER